MASPAVPVVAHELLGTIGNIRTLVQLLARRGDEVDAAERARLLMLVDQRAERVGSVLRDLVRGFPVQRRAGDLDDEQDGAAPG